MDWAKFIMDFLKEILPTLTTFIIGRKSKEFENVKDENEKLKKYKDIDDTEHASDDVYVSSVWK